jgi:hypothetical protein
MLRHEPLVDLPTNKNYETCQAYCATISLLIVLYQR